MVAFAPLRHRAGGGSAQGQIGHSAASNGRRKVGGGMSKANDRSALDDLDRRLMEVLQVDGRRPFT
ncbi:MAG: hypothetical protein ACR2JL_00630, partial [Candidatus Limnocylindrus sp.]